MNIATTPQNHDAETGDRYKHNRLSRSATSTWQLSDWCYSKQVWTFPHAALTLGIPSFHESLASKESHLGKFICRLHPGSLVYEYLLGPL